MKVLLCTVVLLFASCSLFSAATKELPHPYPGRSPWVQAGGTIICRSADMLRDRHGVRLIGSGGNMMRDISILSFTFEVRGPLSVNEARQLALSCLDEIIEQINSDEAARPYLKKHPSDDENVELFLVIRGEDGHSLVDPDISMVSVYNGEIRYDAIDAADEFLCLNKDKETLAEARAQLAPST